MNEAFAAQCIACIRDLGIDQNKLNPKGGAIAIGHPLGAQRGADRGELGSRIARRRGPGLATACIGVGQGLATVFYRE